MNTFQDDIKELEEEIEQLKIRLLKPHLFNTSEQDYDIKNEIIKKQNELINILIEENRHFLNMQRHN